MVLAGCAFMSCLQVWLQRVGKAGYVICLVETNFDFTEKAELRFRPLKLLFLPQFADTRQNNFAFSIDPASLLSR